MAHGARFYLTPVPLIVFYVAVVILGVLSMGFQMLGSRLLNPHFGSAIDVWACLISTFLLAFSVGSMIGGAISNLEPERRHARQLTWALAAVGSLAVVAIWGKPLLNQIEISFEPGNTPILLACLSLFLVPVTSLSTFSPQCVQFLAQQGVAPGKASGLVYGVSTLGNIAGVMLTSFVLIPQVRVSTLLYVWLTVAVVVLSVLLRLLRARSSSSSS